MVDTKKTGRTEMLSGRDLVKGSFKDMDYSYSYKKSVHSIPSFSSGLDSLIGGWHKSDLIVIGGRPGTGKSAFVHNILCHSVTQDVSILLCSPEMRKEMIALRLLSIKSNVACNTIESGLLKEVDWPKLTTAAALLSQEDLNIDDTLPLPVSKISKSARELKADNKLELLFIDSLPFITMGDNESQDEIAVVMMALKSIARELNIPVLLTVPLKTESSELPERYPCLDDIGNDLIVNYADVIILLHKDTPANKKKGKVDALVAKNRNGALGVVPFHFIYQCLRFEERTQQKAHIALEMH